MTDRSRRSMLASANALCTRTLAMLLRMTSKMPQRRTLPKSAPRNTSDTNRARRSSCTDDAASSHADQPEMQMLALPVQAHTVRRSGTSAFVGWCDSTGIGNLKHTPLCMTGQCCAVGAHKTVWW